MIRLSGPKACDALSRLAGRLPEPRRASYRRFRDHDGATLDDGLALWFPGPASATGEDVAELHLHGGRAVVAAVLNALSRIEGLRPAVAGEFTRRAFENDRIDLTEAEGLSDLLAAETEMQRRAAIALAEGAMGKAVTRWQSEILQVSAIVEAQLDFSDEGDVSERWAGIGPRLQRLRDDIAALLVAPPAERLKDGLRVVLAGPPNAGKSSLFNILAGRHAAIVSDEAGTTRDRIEAPVVISDTAFLLIDTAGLHDSATSRIETIGMSLANEAVRSADVVLWLGSEENVPGDAILVASKADLDDQRPGLKVSALTGAGIDPLRECLLEAARGLLPTAGTLALNTRHRTILSQAAAEIDMAASADDELIAAEHLRRSRAFFDEMTGKASTDAMLDTLFGGFCIGK